MQITYIVAAGLAGLIIGALLPGVMRRLFPRDRRELFEAESMLKKHGYRKGHYSPMLGMGTDELELGSALETVSGLTGKVILTSDGELVGGVYPVTEGDVPGSGSLSINDHHRYVVAKPQTNH